MKRRVLKIDKLPTVRRLPAYLTILRELFAKEEQFVSSSYLAERMEIEPILVRKDLELTRINGTPRIGYCIEDLIKGIEDFLGLGETLDAFLVGVGQIGTSILYNRELTNLGLKIVAAFDKEPQKINALIQEVPVFDISRLAELSKRIHRRSGDPLCSAGGCPGGNGYPCCVGHQGNLELYLDESCRARRCRCPEGRSGIRTGGNVREVEPDSTGTLID